MIGWLEKSTAKKNEVGHSNVNNSFFTGIKGEFFLIIPPKLFKNNLNTPDISKITR